MSRLMSASGTKRTSQQCFAMSAFGGKADMTRGLSAKKMVLLTPPSTAWFAFRVPSMPLSSFVVADGAILMVAGGRVRLGRTRTTGHCRGDKGHAA